MSTAIKLITCLFLISQCSCSTIKDAPETKNETTLKIAFGSCASQDDPLLILDDAAEHQPDAFIFLGDNIYGDTDDMQVLRQKYQALGSKAPYQQLKKKTEIIATWDDHDYGRNDAGKHYPHKEASKQVFLEFFEEPKDSSRYEHEGIYHSVYLTTGDKTVQIILLDGRTFRDDLLERENQENKPERYFYDLDYVRHTDSNKTLLGEEQWTWLEEELNKPADCRILASGTQFGIEYNGYEAWANFPHEQERLVQLIKKTQANHMVIISGDVHYAEISKFEHEDCYPLYDITSSGLTKTWKFATPNKNRIEGPVMDNNFGLLTINFSNQDPNIVAEIWDGQKNQRVEYIIPLQEIEYLSSNPPGSSADIASP